MSILAEPRRKRKICLDPQNMAWKKDSNKFGQKMLEKMGWADGDGIGKNKQGITENLRLNANFTQKGIGAEADDAADRTWIAHHDEFSFLLAALNAKKAANVEDKKEVEESSDSEDEMPKSRKLNEDNSKSLEERSKKTTQRIHYKFTKMKDLSRYSAKDKSAVIGVGLKAKSNFEEEKEATPEISVKKEESATVKNSEVSLNDYFAAKMAKFYAKKTGLNETSIMEIKEENIVEKSEVAVEEVDFELEAQRRKAEKKALKKVKCQDKASTHVKIEGITEEDDEEETRLRRKAERKERKRKEREAQAAAEE